MNLLQLWDGQDSALKAAVVPVFVILGIIVTVMFAAALAALARGGGRSPDKDD